MRRTLSADVDEAVPDALDASRNTLEWLWDGLPPAERVVVSALAEAGPGPITQDELEQLLHDSGVRVVIRELQNAPQLLQDWDLIEPADGGYRFRVELLRRWLVERKPLSRVQEEMDRIEPIAESLYRAGLGYYRNEQFDLAISSLRQAIGLNPNHVGANQLLADILLAQGQPGEARELLERLYEYQPAAARSRLTQALLDLAQVEESDDEQLALYGQVLELHPTQPEAAAGKHRIWRQRGDAILKKGNLEAALAAYREAGLADKVAEVEREIHQRDLAAGLQKLESLERERRYQAALALARELADKYPEEMDWQPETERLERKTHLADLYRRALKAWQSDDRQTAQELLIQVISLEPGYEEATRYLHLAVTGEDVVEIRRQLENERAMRQKAEAPAKKKAETRQTRRNAGKKAAMSRAPSGLVVATSENLAQLLAQPEPPARVWWEQAEMELCRVEAGEFLMGSPEGQGRDDEHPQHAVRLDAYYMGRYPVTQAQYARFVRETGHRVPFVRADWAKPYNWDQKRQTPPKGREDHPVVLVFWEDAAAYCKWAGLRLPTEAEWEKAASWVGATLRGRPLRGRPQGQKRIYPWGDEWDAKRCNTREGGKGETTPVGAYSPPGDSPSGCADMAGNAWEWCSSLYKPYSYDPDDGRENLETSGGRVLRGGSWYSDRNGARSAYRTRYLPVDLDGTYAFRCCVSPTSFL